MQFRWPAAVVLGALALASAAAATEVTLDSLLKEMTDFSSVARWPAPEFALHQCSSHDRAKVAPDQPGWFANNVFSQYLREEMHSGRHEHVMMDDSGPGAIVRFWLTTGPNKKGTLRVYLDGATEPAISFPAYDLLAGDLRVGEPLLQPHPGSSAAGNGGSTLMLPIPYTKHCKVTWEEAGDGPRYYQINYRTYAPGTMVRTFDLKGLELVRSRLNQAGESLLAPDEAVSRRTLSLDGDVPAGESAGFDLPAGPAAVRRLELRVTADGAADAERRLRSLVSAEPAAVLIGGIRTMPRGTPGDRKCDFWMAQAGSVQLPCGRPRLPDDGRTLPVGFGFP
jgi:hypothetical protein